MRARFVPAVALLAGACGKSLPADEGAPDASRIDAAPSAADAGTSAAAPPPLPTCPLVSCPASLSSTACNDDDCLDPISAEEVGTVTSDAAGHCGASTGAYLTERSARVSPRRVLGVAFRVVALGTAASPLTIARAGIDGDDSGERFEAVVEGTTIKLCEKSRSETTCTPGVPLPSDVTVHLHGVVSSEDPPRASFALTVACDAPQMLSVTRPFAPGALRGSVGCVDSGGGACSFTFDDFVIFDIPE